MKIAIFHNFLDNIGGAEKVSLILARELKADIYTTNIDRDKIHRMGFKNINIKSIGKVALNAPLRQQSALHKFRQLNLKNQYDFYLICGDWAMSGAVNNKPNLWYVHSPIREIWDLYAYTRNKTVPFFARPVFDLWVFYNRFLNKKNVSAVGKIICNSNNTKKRVGKYLGRQAIVIHPPIDTKKFRYRKSRGYWLSVNRLISHKRIELQLEAFKLLPQEKLIIVGSFEQSRHFKQYAKFIESKKPENVRITSWVNQKELANLYSECAGFISTGLEEDFGMSVIEAMASGKPVIAPNEGGFKESVTPQTGILIDKITPEKIASAIKKLSPIAQNYKNACLKQAANFDTKLFIEKIKQQMNYG